VTWPQLAWHGKALSFISRVLLQLTFDERRAMRAACHSADDRDFFFLQQKRNLLTMEGITIKAYSLRNFIRQILNPSFSSSLHPSNFGQFMAHPICITLDLSHGRIPFP
jgi:hypothetical protein